MQQIFEIIPKKSFKGKLPRNALYHTDYLTTMFKIKMDESFTWRLIGTIDTFLLGWLFSGNPFIGLKIGLVEAISKLILYYLHEKLWYRFDFGLNNRKS